MDPQTKTTSSVENARTIIDIAVLTIRSDDLERLAETLLLLPLADLVEKQWLILFKHFMTEASALNRDTAAEIILGTWKNANVKEEKQSTISLILMSPITNTEIDLLRFIYKSTNTVYSECIDDLLKYPESPDLTVACERCDEVFGEQKFESYVQLANKAKAADSQFVYEYLIEKVREKTPFAKKPEYIADFGYKIPEITVDNVKDVVPVIPIDYPVVDDKTAATVLTDNLKRSGFDVSGDQEKEIMAKYSSLPDEEKKRFMSSFIAAQQRLKLEGDSMLFRLLGPVNPMIGKDLRENHHCCVYGGCRALICSEFDVDENEEPFDWFLGYCQFCNLRIEKRHYAIRISNIHGGWFGCFCSGNCVMDYLNELSGGDDEKKSSCSVEGGCGGGPDAADRETTDQAEIFLQKKMMTEFIRQMNRIGIQDR